MTKSAKFASGRCIHCFRWFPNLTSDHVFPRAWYPRDTPEGLEKWQAPACDGCNKIHVRNEEELLYRLGLCLPHEEIRAMGIAEKALRALDPACGKSDRDRRIREAKRKRVELDVLPFDAVPSDRILPGFGPVPGIKPGRVVKIQETNLKMLALKMATGMSFVLDGRYLDDERYKVDTHVVQEGSEKATIIELIREKGETVARGPGVVVSRVVPSDDFRVALFYIEIWGRFNFFISVLPKVPE